MDSRIILQFMINLIVKIDKKLHEEGDVDLKQYSPKRFQAHISSLRNMRISQAKQLKMQNLF